MESPIYDYVMRVINAPDFLLTTEEYKAIYKAINEGKKVILLKSTMESVMVSSISGFYLKDRIDHDENLKQIERDKKLAAQNKWQCKTCGNILRNDERCFCTAGRRDENPFELSKGFPALKEAIKKIAESKNMN